MLLIHPTRLGCVAFAAVALLGVLAIPALAAETMPADAGQAGSADRASDQSSGGGGWTDDFEAAKARAGKEGKDLLLDFTGSDWCGWCIKLHEEVFDTAKFKAEAPGKFVLVELDFPQQKELTRRVKAQNDALQRQFHIQGFPTILLLDSQGRVYARTGYRAGGAEKYLAHLADAQKVKAARDQKLAEAEKAMGVDRARLLDGVLTDLSKSGVEPLDNREWVAQIISLDGDNAAGLKGKYEFMLRLSDAEGLAMRGRFKEALASVDKSIAELRPTGQAAQDGHYLRGVCQFRQGDVAGARASLKEALAAAPRGERAEEIQSALKQLEPAGG